jgi:hypothetical protein
MRLCPTSFAAAAIVYFVVFGCDGTQTERAASPQSANQGATDPKERELAALPIGIEVTHSPNPVRAVGGGRSGYPFTWLHATRVRPTKELVTIEEFGCFVWQDGRWKFSTMTGKPFTPADFADWYSCPGALLESGKAYQDPRNWEGSTVLQADQTKWYFIGRTADGTRVKGEAVIEMLGEIAADQSNTSRDTNERE